MTIGIDLAKNIFVVHGVNEGGHAELVKPAAPGAAPAGHRHHCRGAAHLRRHARDAGLCLIFYALFWLHGPWCGVGVRFVVCRPFGAA